MQDSQFERIRRLRRRYLDDTPFISAQRARFYTESWRATKGRERAASVRVALAMKHVYDNMRVHIDPDDRIAGTWTEFFLGVPLDIERGLFNGALEVEFDQARMAMYRIASGARFAAFMLKRYKPSELLNTALEISDADVPLLSIGTRTMDRRPVNPYRIRYRDLMLLRRELLPFWKGRTIAERLRDAFHRLGVYSGDMKDMAANMPSGTTMEATIISPLAALGTWQGHLILDHETPLRRGIAAMREDVRRELRNPGNSQEQIDFLRSADLALEGVLSFNRRIVEALKQAIEDATDPERKRILWQMLNDCLRVPENPPNTFRQAVQSYWTVKTAVELAMPFNVHAPGRLDQLLRPWYEADIAAGRITPDQARELCEELFLKIMSHNMRPYSNFTGAFNQRYEGSEPVTLAGQTPDGRDATNPLTYLMLEAAEGSGAALNFVVRFHENSPLELYDAVAAMHARGVSSVSMMNDEICIRAMLRHGFSEQDARNCAVTGCVDLVAPGRTGGEGFSSLLMCRTLDAALRNGDSKTLMGVIRGVGPRTGDPDTFTNFDQLLDAFAAQAAHAVQSIARASRIRDQLYARHLPCPAISAFMQGCIEKKKDVTAGGAVYDFEGILVMNSIANTVDSLFVIKKLVFEENKYTVKRIIEAADRNFKGREELLRDILAVRGKWGNGNPESDALARRITDAVFREMDRHATYKGGRFAPFINSMTSHTIDGRLSGATPDGRLAATPFAASCNPYNVEENGPTGVLRSVAAIDFSQVLGCAVNIRMHPSAIGATPESRAKWAALIRTYFALGGEQIQPTVVSTETLRAAQLDPDSHRNIIVKVGGYSAYFTDLGREIQDEIITRTEHSM